MAPGWGSQRVLHQSSQLALCPQEANAPTDIAIVPVADLRTARPRFQAPSFRLSWSAIFELRVQRRIHNDVFNILLIRDVFTFLLRRN